MSSTEYLLLVLVILIPLAIAVVVTLWSLKQASLRSRKNRKPVSRTDDLNEPKEAQSIE